MGSSDKELLSGLVSDMERGLLPGASGVLTGGPKKLGNSALEVSLRIIMAPVLASGRSSLMKLLDRLAIIPWLILVLFLFLGWVVKVNASL